MTQSSPLDNLQAVQEEAPEPSTGLIKVVNADDKIYMSISLGKAEYKGVKITISGIGALLIIAMDKDGRYKRVTLDSSDLISELVDEFLSEWVEDDSDG